jgi:hypothetical protein
MSARARRSGLARAIGPVWRNPGHAPLRRVIPLIRGKEMNRNTGRPQRPLKNRGQLPIFCFAQSKGCECTCAPQSRSSPRKRGPRAKHVDLEKDWVPACAGTNGDCASSGGRRQAAALSSRATDPGLVPGEETRDPVFHRDQSSCAALNAASMITGSPLSRGRQSRGLNVRPMRPRCLSPRKRGSRGRPPRERPRADHQASDL